MRHLLTVEERFYSSWYPWRLFDVGAAAFADVGRSFGHNAIDAPNLDGDPSIKNMQFLIETKRSF